MTTFCQGGKRLIFIFFVSIFFLYSINITEILNIMTKTLINLIKNSKLVTITGPIGSGKSLLLNKLAHHSQLTGTILTNKEQLTSLPSQGNIFIDDISFMA